MMTTRLAGVVVNAWAPSEGERSIALRIADVSGREVPEPHVPRRSSRLTPSVEVEVEKPDIDPDGDGIDLWGRSARARQVTRALMEPAYRYWFRFSFEHLSRIPAQGGALLVANHAGVIPIDAALVMHGIERDLAGPSAASTTTDWRRCRCSGRFSHAQVGSLRTQTTPCGCSATTVSCCSCF